MTGLFAFLLAMWVLMLLGGAVAVVILGPFSISGHGSLDPLLTYAAKAAIAVVLISAWVFALSQVKNWMFRRDLSS